METVNIKINGMPLSVPKESTILEAARSASIRIPTLCFLKEINEIGACRICVVEVKGARTLVASCVYPVSEGMEIFTNTPRVRNSRKLTLELILSNHERKCLSCIRSDNCELRQLAHEYHVEEDTFLGFNPHFETDRSAAHMVRDNHKCILCRRCVAVCAKTQGIGVIGANHRGFEANIGCAFEQDLGSVACVGCGQCVAICPTGALVENDQTQEVLAAISDPLKHVIVQTAPAVRAALGEEFGLPIGTNVQGKMVAALRRLGFERVFDTDLAADLTIVEEANELMERLKNGGALPLITSCSPGWVKYCEHYWPDFIPNLSSCKSPQQMFGAVCKTWYAQKMGWNPEDILMVSVMPCTAKKFEVGRDHEDAAGVPDVDISITTRELARMIKQAGLVFNDLPDEEFDQPLGESTGAAVIFGATGGVMEAALRTAAEWVGGKPLENVEFSEVRGMEGIKEASYPIGDLTVKVAVASGLANAKKLLKRIQAGEAQYHFVEVMACPGGCVNGGGQPIQPADVHNFVDYITPRAKALYDADEASTLRSSHKNPVLQTIYKEFFGEFGSHKAHECLHTSYKKRKHF